MQTNSVRSWDNSTCDDVVTIKKRT